MTLIGYNQQIEWQIAGCSEHRGDPRHDEVSAMPSSDNTTIPTKICKRCGKTLPATLEYFHKGKGNAGGLRPQCRVCRSQMWKEDSRSKEYTKRNYERNKEKILARGKAYAKAHPEIARKAKRKYKQVHKEKVREQEQVRASRPHNREKQRQYARNRYWSNPELRREKRKQYRKDNPEKERETNRRWRKSHPEIVRVHKQRYYRKHADQVRARVRSWSQNNPQHGKERYWRNPEKSRLKGHIRRARIKGLPSTLTVDNWERALEYFKGCCAVCGRPAGLWHTISQDHWIPLSNPSCPGTVPENIVPLCNAKKDGHDGCNNSKNNQEPIAWLNWKFGPRKAKRILARIQAYFDSLKDDKP